MLTLREILSCFVTRLREKVNCSISSQDISERFEKNTLYIYFDNVKQNDYMKKFVEKNITVRLIYFPKDDKHNTIELLEMQDILLELFTVEDIINLKNKAYAQINSVNTNRHDGTVLFDFDAYIFEAYDEKSYPNMEEITIKGGK